MVKLGNEEREYVRSPSVMTLVKFALYGAFSGQALLLVLSAAALSSGMFKSRTDLFVARGEVLLIAVCLTIYFARYQSAAFLRMLRSRRFDLFIAVISGLIAALSFPPFGYALYQPLFKTLNETQIVAALAVPACLMLVFLSRAFYPALRRSVATIPPPLVLNDLEKTNPSDDLLNVREQASRFANYVINGGSIESVVFGIDAPWGAGKSTFINFCIAEWRAVTPSTIVYRFNPIQYEDRSHLLNKFIDGLILTLRSQTFIPELSTILSRYEGVVTAKKTLTVAGIDIDLSPPKLTAEEASENLKYALRKLKQRLIIVVDDLDRMEFSTLKDMLFVIKKGFFLPNVSFVLCYDVQNIAAMEGSSYDEERISEFLEKFVNVRISLYPSSTDLKNYIGENLRISLSGNLLSNFSFLDSALAGLRALYDSNDYHLYAPLVGDVRKIKRLLNTLILIANASTPDLNETDLLPTDFIRLLLLQLNYPATFRQIVNAETAGKSGAFSAQINAADATFDNSPFLADLLKQLKKEGRHTERFLLQDLFDVGKRFTDRRISSVPADALHTYACFNSDEAGARNLVGYLDLILKAAPPERSSQYKFYTTILTSLKNGTPIAKIMQTNEFSARNGESPHDQLWRVVVNSVDDFDQPTLASLIGFIVSFIPQYSYMQIPKIGLGLRHRSITYTLLKLLDVGGWKDKDGDHRDNTNSEDLGEIADWMLGHGQHAGESIVELLTSSERGVLGWHDFLSFRLSSCVNRGTPLFNLQRAMTWHSDPETSFSGPTDVIVVTQMREITQFAFRRFKHQYVIPQRNFLKEVDELPTDRLVGMFSDFVAQEYNMGHIDSEDLDESVASAKSTLKAFCVYQLTAKMFSSGIGCGFYDEDGAADDGGISKVMNQYLFGTCFAPDRANDGHMHFVSFFLVQLQRPFGGSRRYTLPVEENWVDKSQLKMYWLENRSAIIGRHFEQSGRRVVTPNFDLTYSVAVPILIEAMNAAFD